MPDHDVFRLGEGRGAHDMFPSVSVLSYCISGLCFCVGGGLFGCLCLEELCPVRGRGTLGELAYGCVRVLHFMECP